MLVDRARGKQCTADDAGAVLVTVVVVMFVGFVIAVTIAASVIFTTSANAGNLDRTQAFISAESGRDVAVHSIRSSDPEQDGIDCATSALSNAGSGANPNYEYDFYVSTFEGTPDVDAPRDDATAPDGWFTACPDLNTRWILVESTGWRTESVKATVLSVYEYTVEPASAPSGTVAFFEGEFKATKSTYTGDLVIRDGDYECNNGASGAIQGDLWVLRGGMTITDDCTITGNVYVRDTITVQNKEFKVGGDVLSLEGQINLFANSTDIGGDVWAAGDIDTNSGSGVVDGSFKTPMSVIRHDETDWTRADLTTPVPVDDIAAAPTVVPSLDQVYDATSWIELTPSTTWSSATNPVYAPPPGTVCTTTELQTVMGAPGVRTVIDMTGCPAGGQGIPVKPGNATVARDVAILVPPNQQMDLHLSGTISRPPSTDLETGPQLFIIHLDPNGVDGRPPTCSSSNVDKFTAGGVNNVRTMIYSPCGINSAMSLTMSGQLYMGSDGLRLTGGVFACKPMSWEPTLPTISCGVRSSDVPVDPDDQVFTLQDLHFQTEQ